MDKTIREYFNLSEYKGDIGIEIEVEGVNIPMEDTNKFWSANYDGSLKSIENSEYVTNNPVRYSTSLDHIAHLSNIFKDNSTTINDSMRAGVHIHLNMQEMTKQQVSSIAALFYIVEPILLDYCGEGRVGNLFCLSSDRADWQIKYIADCIKEDRYLDLCTDNIRYCALNWKPITTFGTLEVRCLKTPNNIIHIQKWIRLLQRIVDYGAKVNNINELLSDVSGCEKTQFLEKIFGPLTKWLPIESDVEDKIFDGVRRAQQIVAAENIRQGLDKYGPHPYIEKTVTYSVDI